MLLSSLLQCVILIQWKPFEEPFVNRLEIYNEVTAILLVYALMVVTDYTPKGATRHLVGFAYIAIGQLNILLHLLRVIAINCITCR